MEKWNPKWCVWATQKVWKISNRLQLLQNTSDYKSNTRQLTVQLLLVDRVKSADWVITVNSTKDPRTKLKCSSKSHDRRVNSSTSCLKTSRWEILTKQSWRLYYYEVIHVTCIVSFGSWNVSLCMLWLIINYNANYHKGVSTKSKSLVIHFNKIISITNSYSITVIT